MKLKNIAGHQNQRIDLSYGSDVRPFGDSLGLVQATDPLLGTSVMFALSSEAACQSESQIAVVLYKPAGKIDLYRFLAFWTLEFNYSRCRRDFVQDTPATVWALLGYPHLS